MKKIYIKTILSKQNTPFKVIRLRKIKSVKKKYERKLKSIMDRNPYIIL